MRAIVALVLVVCCLSACQRTLGEIGNTVPEEELIEQIKAGALSDAELLRLLGHGFDPEKFDFFHGRPEYPTGGFRHGPSENSLVTAVACLALTKRIDEKNEPAYTSKLLEEALKSGNWLEFCVMAGIAARTHPSSQQAELLLRAYHMEKNAKAREAILLALEIFITTLEDAAPLTEAVLTYMTEAWRLEPSRDCLAQWARVYSYALNHVAFETEVDMFGVRHPAVPPNTLLEKFEHDRRVRDKVPSHRPPTRPWGDGFWDLLEKFPVFPPERD